jgi:hypothetical protein
VGKLEGMRQLGKIRHPHGWEDNIKIDLREIGWSGVDWIHPAKNRENWRALVNTVKNVRFHKIIGNS